MSIEHIIKRYTNVPFTLLLTVKYKGDGGGGHCLLLTPDGVASSRMVGVSASVNLPLHHKVQKFSSGTCSPGWSRKKGSGVEFTETHLLFQRRQLAFEVDDALLRPMSIQPLSLEVFAVGVHLLTQGLGGVLLRPPDRIGLVESTLGVLESTQQLVDAHLVLVLNHRQLLRLRPKLFVLGFSLHAATRDI